MAKHGRGYLNLGLPWIINIILAVFPLTSWILGGITRICRGHIIAGILQFIPPITLIFWVADIITVIISKDLRIFA